MFDADFSKLDLDTSRVIGTYTITFHEWFADNLTVPTGRYWSPSKLYRDFSFALLSEETPEGHLHRYRSFETPIEDELNLTAFPLWFPFDYYITGVVAAFNTTMEFKEVLVSADLASEMEGSWSISYDLGKIDVNSPEVSFLSISQEELNGTGWDSISMYSLTFSFHRRQLLLPSGLFFMPIVLIVALIICWIISLKTKKQHPTIFTGIASLHLPFVGIVWTFGPHTLTFEFMSLLAGFFFGLFSGVAQFYIRSQREAEIEEEIRSLLGNRSLLQVLSENAVPADLEKVSVSEGDEVSITDHETGKQYEGLIIDTNFFIKMSYSDGEMGFFKNQLLVELSEPLPEKILVLETREGFPIGVIWAVGKTHAVAAKIPGERASSSL